MCLLYESSGFDNVSLRLGVLHVAARIHFPFDLTQRDATVCLVCWKAAFCLVEWSGRLHRIILDNRM
jgi:hypothetical protein